MDARKITKSILLGLAAGAAAAYFIHPKSGKKRRAALTSGAGNLLNQLRTTLALSSESPGFELERTIRINAPIPESFPTHWLSGKACPVPRLEILAWSIFIRTTMPAPESTFTCSIALRQASWGGFLLSCWERMQDRFWTRI